jgi:small subunit ribosomal protein S20
MPNTKSTAKRLRQDEVRKARNRSVKSALKTQVKKVASAVQEGDLEKAEAQFRLAAKKLDQAGAKNVMHKNAVARKKSRLQRMIVKAKKPA